jgi:transcription elongation factor GreA
MFQKKPAPVPITQKGFDEAMAELNRLSVYREEVLIRLQAAREMGDLSENGAYKAARFELSDTDRKLRQLKFISLYGQIVTSKNNGTIDFDAHFTLKYNSTIQEFHLVSPQEADPAKHKISIHSPLGQAVIGKKSGDEIEFSAPAGVVHYTVLSVIS